MQQSQTDNIANKPFNVYYENKNLAKKNVNFHRTLVKSVFRKFNFLISQPKTFVVGIQKKRLNETVLFSSQNIC